MTRPRPALHSRPLVALSAGACLLVLAACGSGSDSDGAGASAKSTASTKSADGGTVDTALLAFSPKTVRVMKGQTVTWVGGDNIAHVLVQGSYQVGGDGLRTQEADDRTFSLKLNRKGQRVSHTYTSAGTFTYFCTIHRGMNGTVVVS